MTQEEKKKKNSRNIIIIIVAVLLLIISPFVLCIGAGFFGAMYESTYEENIPYESEIIVEEEEEEVVISSAVGESVTIDEVTWTLLEAVDEGNRLTYIHEYFYLEEYDCVSDEGKYIYLKVKVENNSSEPISVYNPSLYNSEGTEFWTASDIYLCIENDISYYETINPGLELTYEAAYEVSKDDSGFKYIVKDLGYSESEIMFELDF